MIMSEEKVLELQLMPIAEIIAQATAAKKPIEFTTASVDSIKKVFDKTKLDKSDIDLYEINEAFALVSLAVNDFVELTGENVNGGAEATSLIIKRYN